MTRRGMTRRKAMTLIGAASGSLSIPLGVGVANARANSHADTVLVDVRFLPRERLPIQKLLEGRLLADLEPEIVRAWRDGIETSFRTVGHLDVIARWDHLNVLSGLVREAGGQAKHRRIGPNVFYIRLTHASSPRAAPT